jgi:hypothetical protein
MARVINTPFQAAAHCPVVFCFLLLPLLLPSVLLIAHHFDALIHPWSEAPDPRCTGIAEKLGIFDAAQSPRRASHGGPALSTHSPSPAPASPKMLCITLAARIRPGCYCGPCRHGSATRGGRCPLHLSQWRSARLQAATSAPW